MWDYSSIEDKWKKRNGNLDKRIFNYLRQEIDDVRYYSKCLDGSSYVYASDLNNVYDLNKDDITYKISKDYSTYYNGTDNKGESIISGDIAENGFYDRYKNQYGKTVRNLFSPKRLFETVNYQTVDYATTEEIDIDNASNIDGKLLVNNNRVLVKDNFSTISLNNNIDPENYFNHNYEIIETIGNQTTYRYLNSENGVYKYVNNTLIRENDLENSNNYSTYVKYGNTNSDKSFHLNTLKNGLYPIEGEPLEFEERIDYIVRNSLEYRNVLDNIFYASYVQEQESLTINDETYFIPNRLLVVGDFGTILNFQNDYTNIIENKVKENLKHITSYKYNYYICGDKGTLIKMSKIDLSIEKIDIPSFENLLSICINDKGEGVIVGENGEMLKSNDLKNWEIVNADIENNINSVLNRNVYAKIAGNNGVYGEVKNGVFTQENLYIRENEYDTRDIRNDFNNIYRTSIINKRYEFNNSWDNQWVDIRKNINSSFSIDFTFKPTALSDNQTLMSFQKTTSALNNYEKGIKVFIKEENGEYRLKLSIRDNNNNEVLLDGDVTLENDKWYSVFVTRYKNEYRLFVNNYLSDSITDGFSGNFDNNNTRIRIGGDLVMNNNSYVNFSGNFFEGVINDFRIWNERLDNNEVLRYMNIYPLEIPTKLLSWYIFDIRRNDDGNEYLPTRDLVENRRMILNSFSNITHFNNNPSLRQHLLLNENYDINFLSGDNVLAAIIDVPDSYYNKEVNNTFFMLFENENIKNIFKKDDYLYCISDKRMFRIDIINLDLNLLNFINKIEHEDSFILTEGYNNISYSENLDNIYLINNSENEINKISLNDICILQGRDRLENCTPYISFNTLNTTNSIEIENEYVIDVTDNQNTNSINYIKAIPSSTYSIVDLYVEESGNPLPIYKQVYLSLELENLFGGYIEVSFNGVDFEELREDGEYLIPFSVGNESTLTFRPVLENDVNYQRVKGNMSNITLYEADCVQDVIPYIYNNGQDIRKLYFPQFDFPEEVNSLTQSNYLYSYLDIKSLEINGNEQINFGTYSVDFPKYMYKSDVQNNLVDCDTLNLCNTGSQNDTIDRIRHGFGLTVSQVGTDYEYIGATYGLLESFTINNNQIFGIDTEEISNIDNPIHLGIDINKDFYFEVDSFILTETDVLNTYSTQSVIVSSTISYGTISGDYFNQISFTNSYTTYSVPVNIEEDRRYYIEADVDGNVDFIIGNQTFNMTSMENEIFLADANVSNIIIDANTYSTVNNLVITDKTPHKHIVSWDKENCHLEHIINGNTYSNYGFIQEDGSIYSPSCELALDCENSTTDIVNNEYWDAYKSKMLFLDYDVASKLYFFDIETGDYHLPKPVIINDIRELTIESLEDENSWIDYSRDSLKEFRYLEPKNNTNLIKYNNKFRLGDNYTYTSILNGNSTKDLTDINGTASGLLPSYNDLNTIGEPTVSKDFYFYDRYLVIKIPSNFEVEEGDIINIKNSLIDDNSIVVRKEVLTDTYIYLKTNFNDSIINRLIKWSKNTVITNLNIYNNINTLINNFNLHPINIGYTLSLEDNSVKVEGNFNPKTAYYNLQANIKVLNNIFVEDNNSMLYEEKIGDFGFAPTYNILSYLSKNPIFNEDFEIASLPSYMFPNNNSGALYNVNDNYISMNSDLKKEWDSIPLYTFLDITVGNTTLESILVIDKVFENDRYLLKFYDYYAQEYEQSDFSGNNINIRVRNKLGEISNDLMKLNNIQYAKSYSKHIVDLSNEAFTTYDSYKKLNFRCNTDSYVKAFLSQREIKEYLTAIEYTDDNNCLSINVLNLNKHNRYTITSIDRYYIECDSCEFEDYTLFENSNNSNFYNQYNNFSGNISYTNRVPYSTYGFYNQIYISGSSSTVPIPYPTNIGGSAIIELTVDKMVDSYIEIVLNSNVVYTIGSVPENTLKIPFNLSAPNNLEINVVSSSGNSLTVINDIRIGNSDCLEDCYLTKFKLKGNDLSIGEGINISIEDDIFQLENEYESNFGSATNSGWIVDNGSSTASLGITQGLINYYATTDSTIYYSIPLNLDINSTYRMSFDYSLVNVTGSTAYLNPSFGETESLDTTFENLSLDSSKYVETNFISTTSSVYIGFKQAEGTVVEINNISIDKLENRSKYYNGYHSVYGIEDDYIIIDRDYIGNVEEISATYTYINECGVSSIRTRILSDIGYVDNALFDPFLNYEPIDLYELGNDLKINKSIEVRDNNWEIMDEKVSLVNMDFDKYRFRMVDNLTYEEILDKYPWFLEAEVTDAIVGKDENGLVWYSGIWECGRWLDGTWYSGTWLTGVWYSGTRYNSKVDINRNGTVEIEALDSSIYHSVWKNGTWFGGTWKNGKWESGRWFDGTWENGLFLDGIWDRGTWKNGIFRRGDWFDGTWENGQFDCSLGLSRWFNGEWYGGDFKCGIWYTGLFDSKFNRSIFGEGSTLTRKAIWKNGYMLKGDFYSGNNSRHDLTIWETGKWNFGRFNGGTVYQINVNNSIWNNGVMKDIPVLGFYGDTSGEIYFIIEGNWDFRAGDDFWVINNGIYNPLYGNDNVPNKYKVDLNSIHIDGNTKVYVRDLPNVLLNEINNQGSYMEGIIDKTNDLVSENYITKIVPYISKTELLNSRIENAIFDGRYIRNGLWYKGSFISGDFGF